MSGGVGQKPGLHVWVPLGFAVASLSLWVLGWGLSGRRGRPDEAGLRPPATILPFPVDRTNTVLYGTDMNNNVPARRKSEERGDIFAKPDSVVPDPGNEEILL